MTFPAGIEVTAAVHVQRGTAAACACGGTLEKLPELEAWQCRDCGKASG